MVIFASPSRACASSPSRSCVAAVMSAVTRSWNAGACHASVRRRAIVLRMLVSGTSSISPAGAAAGAGVAAGCFAARSTSSATIRPSGPVPESAARSTPSSRAMRRASGDALMRPPAVAGLPTAELPPLPCAACSAASRPRSRSPSRAGPSAGFSAPSSAAPSSGRTRSGVSPFDEPSADTSSPCSPITATVRPTSTSPSWTAILSRTPEASASTSWVTFSVSSS